MPNKDPLKRSAYDREYRLKHIEKMRDASRKWLSKPGNRARSRAATDIYRATPEGQLKIKNRKLAVYGLTVADWETIFARQGSCCACCSSVKPGKVGWHVDHDHSTKIVRGIICGRCNMGIGLLGDHYEGVHRASEYLRSPNADIEGYA